MWHPDTILCLGIQELIVSTTDIGRSAERAVADHLRALDYDILQQNWRTRWCEIDVVAQKAQTIYYVEVKYRKNDYHGDGLAYITPRKLQQMHFAVELWVSNHRWNGDYILAAASVTGKEFEIVDFIEL